MKTISTHKNTFTQVALTLLMVLATTLTASATDFITDVMVAGNKNESEFNTLIGNLTQQGWTDIDYDLNKGCGSSSYYIHLLYKTQSSSGNTGVPITDFYIRTGANPPDYLTYDGRTYYLAPCQGNDNFVSGHGDLNAGCGSSSDYIFLYYTKDVLSNNTGVTAITFNTTQSGAVGENGGSTGYDLNTGCGSGSAYIYMHFSTASGGNVVTLSSGSGEVQLQNGHILTGTGGANTHVTIADGATVTLNGVNNTAITISGSRMWPGISCLGNATIVLGGNTTNTVKGGYQSSGIFVPQGKHLTLQGSGTLNATGNRYAAGIGSGKQQTCGNITISGGTVNASGGQYGAGIGSGSDHSDCGTIIINGGTVTATGGEYAAGIGSGSDHSDCWHISIYNTVTLVNATMGSYCDNAIGAGSNGSTCQSVTIGSVETGFITQSPFVTFPYTVAFDANGGTNSMSSQSFMYNVAQNLFMNIFTRTYYEFEGWATSATGPKVYDDEQSVSNLTATSGATVTLYAKWIPYFPYTVAFDANGGTGTMNNQSFTYNVAQNLTANSFIRTYYEFEGWATSADGPKVYDDTQCVSNLTQTPCDTVTLYAKWIFPYTVAFDANGGTGTMNNQSFTYNVAQSLTPNSFSRQDYLFVGWATSTDGPKVYSDGQWVSNLTQTPCDTVTLYAKWIWLGSIPGELLLHDGDTLTGTGGPLTHVSIADGATVTFSGVDITTILEDDEHKWPGITCLGDAVIVLAEGATNSVKGGKDNPGIYVPQNKTLSLQGSGILNATGGGTAAGIGSSWDSSCGNIIISSGTITANGGQYSAGIGSGWNSSCGNITIDGGNVTANGSQYGAGIGSGWDSSCGNIIISSGTITANGGAAGIGSGWDSSCGNIIISSGTITANGGQYSAGIGSGWNSSCGNITIDGGNVTANGSQYGAGIGSGRDSSCDDIIISNGNVTANGGQYSAGIGSGYGSSSCDAVTISGGNVTATGGDWAAGIGSGYGSSSCDAVTISGGNVTATGGDWAAGIGSGRDSTCGNITITNGVTRVTAAKGDNCNNAIGAGKDSTCGTVTIGGVETGFITQSPFIIITKRITGYGTSTGGWYLIASPTAGNTNVENVGGLISTTPAHYDLYRFNQAAELEWENWKAIETDNYHFNLESGCGYLYANQDGTTLTFSGMPYTGNGEVTLQKTSGVQFEGWNLIGNPFGTAKTIGNKPFYRMNALGTEIIAAENNIVDAMEGIFVVAETDGEIVTFAEVSRENGQGDERIVLNLSGPSTGSETAGSTAAVIDRAIVRFGEGPTLPKSQISNSSTKIYIPQDGKDYALVNVGRDSGHTLSTMDVHFKAAENGTYTLTTNTDKAGMSYLHLIDSLTSTDVDLLVTPTYTFTATTHDNASRFRLVFNVSAERQEEPE